MKSEITKRHLYFFLFTLIVLVGYSPHFMSFIRLTINEMYYHHVIFIPFISGYLIYRERRIFGSDITQYFWPGVIIIMTGLALYGLSWKKGPTTNLNDELSVIFFSAWLTWIGGFVLIYDRKVFRVLAFPLLFLLLMVPVPSFVLDWLIVSLQRGTAEFTDFLFKLIGIHFIREGFVFHLPNLSIEIAEACGGIRSSIALFITCVLFGYLCLNTYWRRLVFILMIIPVTFIKNGIRIVTLSLLGVYIDKSILTEGWLHTKAGVVFVIPALLILIPVLYFLRKSEKEQEARSGVHSTIVQK